MTTDTLREAVFDILRPLQPWEGDEAVCRAAVNAALSAIEAAGWRVVPVEPDTRPALCRFRLVDEGKPYPKSACNACGKTITTGIGKSCQLGAAPRLDATVRGEEG